MAQTATMYRVEIALSDVDRNVYETLDLRVARHPSETMRFMLTRIVAYALSYEEGIAFSKGGISDVDEPSIAVRDLTGILLAWIDVGSPSAERLHKGSKSARRVALFTYGNLGPLTRAAEDGQIHRAAEIDVYVVATAFLDALEPHFARHTKLELTRNEGLVYVTVDGTQIETELRSVPLAPTL